MKKYIFSYFFFTSFIIIFCKENSIKDIKINEEDEIIELKDLETPLPSPNDPDIFYIPIILTNDIHGSFYPKKMLLPSGITYSIGGLEYLGKYISIMYEEWKDRLLFFDAGDQFQGGLEGYISQGKIIMDFFNEVKTNNSVIGNHDFDYGLDFLKDYMNSSKFDWVIDNIKNLTTGKHMTFPKQKITTMLEIEGIKIGIIGLVTIETPSTTNTVMPDLVFEEYLNIIDRESSSLKKKGANAIIVLGHLGVSCKDDSNNIKLEYKLRDKNTIQGTCSEGDEAFILLSKLKKDTIDLFLGGHKHTVSHNWINDIPFISSDSNGKYAEIVYLPFNKTSKQLINDKILIEGPLPGCEKLFQNNKVCDLTISNEEEETKYGKLLNFTFHDKMITKDETITKIGDKYRPLYNEYDNDYLTVTYENFGVSKGNEMGNFYTEFLRHISGADISVVNPGAFRTAFYRGNITNATVHSFDPFGNDLVLFQAYGWEIKKMFSQLQKGSKGFYLTSGLKMTVRNKPSKKLISIKLYDGFKEKEIQDNQLYTIASSDFCFPLEPKYKGGDDFETVYKWFRPRNGTYVNISNFYNSRDMLIDYMRKIDELKGSKYYNEDDLRLRTFSNK